MTKQVLNVGILCGADYRKRTIAIAKGEYVPGKDEPKIWFGSFKSVAQVLSRENQELIRLILETSKKAVR